MEDCCGQVTEDSGGRIDIVVKDRNGKTILIENKIYAGDQKKQMERYRNEHPKAKIFYLTLEGKKPKLGLSDDDVKRIRCNCISYKDNILAWLKKCREAAACLPNVRETISQYIHLIEELTNQSTTILMSKELIDKIVESKESLQAFYTLRNAEIAVQTELIANLDAKLDDFAKTTGLNLHRTIHKLSEKWGGFYFTTPETC